MQTKPAPTHADLETMFDQMERYIRETGPLTHKELSAAEQELWRSKFRGERRNEPNQLFGFTTLRVLTYCIRCSNDARPGDRDFASRRMHILPGMVPTAPDGWEISSQPIWDPCAVVAAFRSLRDARPSEFAKASNERDDARRDAWEARTGRKAFNPTAISRAS